MPRGSGLADRQAGWRLVTLVPASGFVLAGVVGLHTLSLSSLVLFTIHSSLLLFMAGQGYMKGGIRTSLSCKVVFMQ